MDQIHPIVEWLRNTEHAVQAAGDAWNRIKPDTTEEQMFGILHLINVSTTDVLDAAQALKNEATIAFARMAMCREIIERGEKAPINTGVVMGGHDTAAKTPEGVAVQAEAKEAVKV